MHNYDKGTIAEVIKINIRKYRKLRGLTSQQLAEKTPLSYQYVRDVESLKVDKTPSIEALCYFANALDIDIRQLFDEVDEDSINRD